MSLSNDVLSQGCNQVCSQRWARLENFPHNKWGILFPVEISFLVHPKQISVVSKSDIPFPLHFKFSSPPLLQFPYFSSQFSLFLASLFPFLLFSPFPFLFPSFPFPSSPTPSYATALSISISRSLRCLK